MRSPYFSEVFSICCDFLNEAGDEARKEFFEKVNKAIRGYYRVRENDFRKASFDFSVDFSNDLYSLGDGYVYAYITNDGELFYIGCGQHDRVCNIYSRSDEFKEIYEKGASPFVIASRVYKTKAEEIETLCIWVAQMNGCVLKNERKTLSDFELKCFLAKEKGKEIKMTPCVEEKWEQYENLKIEYEEVFENLEQLLIVCLDKEEYKKIIPKEKEYIPAVQSQWTINGETKSIADWCKEYNKSQSCVKGRMIKWGLSPLQALTLPAVPNDKNRLDPIGYWKSLGLLDKNWEIPA